MDEGERKFKYGQFGYGKYVYPGETIETIGRLFRDGLAETFPGARVEYLV